MRNVRMGHDPVLVANTRHAPVLEGAAVDGDILADHITIANLEPCRFPGILLVLRCIADRGELVDPVSLPDLRRTIDDDMRADLV